MEKDGDQYRFGAWMFFNGLQDLITKASKASKPQPSASQLDIGNMKRLHRKLSR
jgi:hypothetical protein